MCVCVPFPHEPLVLPTVSFFFDNVENQTMDTKLSTTMKENVSDSTNSAAVAKRKVPLKPKGKNSSKASVKPSGAKPSQPCVVEPPASSDMSITQ